MRAGRLLSLMLLLERRGRLTARELAVELEVSERTVLRDVEALSGAGIPVFAVRGPGGGFELLGGGAGRLHGLEPWLAGPRHRRRAVIRITDEGRRVAANLGWPDLAAATADDRPSGGDTRVVVRVPSLEGLARRLLALAGDAEVLEPAALRDQVRGLAQAAAAANPPTTSG